MSWNLFLDSSHYLSLGLLDEQAQWLSYNQYRIPKSSSLIHAELDLLFKKYNSSIEKIGSIIYVAGPGTYTGMRMAHGVAEVCELFGPKLFSFYHFQVPFLLGVERGVWISSAFKGEYFFYQWDKEKNEQKLMSGPHFKNALEKILDEQIPCYSYFDAPASFSSWLPEGLFIEDTASLIQNSIKELLPQVITRKLCYPTFYYRSLTDEFKTLEGPK